MLVAVLVAAAFAAGWVGRGLQDARSGAPAGVAPAVAATRAQDCRDDCEQRATVEQLGDDWLRSCRNGCGPTGAAGGAARPYEPIKRITRAPADHRPR